MIYIIFIITKYDRNLYHQLETNYLTKKITNTVKLIIIISKVIYFILINHIINT